MTNAAAVQRILLHKVYTKQIKTFTSFDKKTIEM